jgi:hypothetical protein
MPSCQPDGNHVGHISGACARLRQDALARYLYDGCCDKHGEAEALIEKIERHRKDHKQVPRSIRDLGYVEDEGGPVYCRNESIDHYVVWYGTVLGESRTYDSRTQTWE